MKVLAIFFFSTLAIVLPMQGGESNPQSSNPYESLQELPDDSGETNDNSSSSPYGSFGDLPKDN